MSATPTSSATASAKPKAPAQSILDDHHDPTQVNANDPIVLFIIQVTFIVVLCRLLAIPLRKIRQPMVISEVIGGILLGPSVFGQIDGFTQHIFPKASLTYLNLVSTIGLVLFLFLVGLEVDFKVFRSNARKSIEEQDRKSSDFVPTTPLTLEVPTKVDALRLVELTQRSSAVFKASETDPRPDPLDGIFNTFVNLSGLSGTTSSALVDSGEFSTAVSSTVNERRSELVILPWATKFEEKEKADRFPVYNPFGGIWRTDSVAEDDGASYYSSFVRNVFRDSEVDVAVLLDRTFSSKNGSGAKLFLPFFGGPDDRAALELLVQLCRKKGVYGAVVRIERREGLEEDELEKKLSATSDSTEGGSHLKPGPAALEFMKKVSAGATGTVGHGATVMPDTVYGHQDTATKMISDSADSILLNRYFPTSNSEEVAHSASVQAALSRISYEVVRTSAPLRIALQRIEHACTAEGTKGSATLVLTGRGRRSAESHAAEESMFLKEYVATRGHGALGICSSSDVRRTLGAVGTGATVKGLGDGVLVVQAALTSPEAAKRNV
ncbi:hypothetical protein BT69DRAFT_1306224 [Atractiella rhizophila]|nr:hypothetical protein BT69DRAFT_1306224 [Atractiella rhizophila]